MTNKVYVIADLHLGHKKVAELRGFDTTENHDNYIVGQWNHVVRERDVVYVLGDIFQLKRIPELKGIKKLALGNHDTRKMEEYTKLFSKVHAGFKYRDCLLTHIPVHESQFHRFKLNIHGHMHSKKIEDSRYQCVSIEHIGYAPILLNSIVDKNV